MHRSVISIALRIRTVAVLLINRAKNTYLVTSLKCKRHRKCIKCHGTLVPCNRVLPLRKWNKSEGKEKKGKKRIFFLKKQLYLFLSREKLKGKEINVVISSWNLKRKGKEKENNKFTILFSLFFLKWYMNNLVI